MTFLVRWVVSIVLLVESASARPSPGAPLPAPKTVELPTPSGTPEPQFRPDLLPESTALPAEPLDLRLPSPSGPLGTNGAPTERAVNQLSPDEQQENRVRLSEIPAIAMRSSRVIDLLREADHALTDEARREFMRAYYHTLCTRMRILEPGLTGAISDYERVQIRQLAQGPARIAIVSLQTHRRQRRARQ